MNFICNKKIRFDYNYYEKIYNNIFILYYKSICFKLNKKTIFKSL